MSGNLYFIQAPPVEGTKRAFYRTHWMAPMEIVVPTMRGARAKSYSTPGV